MSCTSGVTYNVPAGSPPAGTTHTVTVKDDGNPGCQKTTNAVTVGTGDITNPTIGSPGANATLECPATPSFTAPTASDNSGSATVTNLGDTTSGNTCAQVTTRSWRAVDACGNTSGTVSQAITVRDTTNPTIGSPGANATIECPNTPNFTQTRTWRAVDGCGNTSGTVSQTITVRDTTAPTIGGQGSNATIQCPATPSFTAPTASDACGGSTVVNDGDSTANGTCANDYAVARRCDAEGDCGNTSAQVSQTVTVRDTTAPTIGGQGSDATIECPATPSFTAPTASDACGGSTVVNDG